MATPSDGNTASVDPASDPDARLVDVTDESWGVILQHRLHNSNSTVEFRPCLASGYLVKRGADNNTDVSGRDHPESPRGPIAVGINLLWIGSTPGGHQPQRAAAVAAAAAAAQAAQAAASSTAATPTSSSTHNPNISIPLKHLEAAAAAAGSGGGVGNGSSSLPGTNSGGATAASSPLPSPAGGAMGQGVGVGATGVGPFANQAARTTYDTVLKEFLTTYRGLGLLARLKGMRGTRGGAVPWHIAAALRGVRAVERCL